MKKVFVLLFCIALLVGCSNPKEKLTSLDDVLNKRVGVVLGTVPATYAEKNWPDAKLFLFNSLADAVLAVKADRVDCVLYDTVVLETIVDINPIYAHLPGYLTEIELSPLVKKGNTDMLEKMNAFIKSVIDNGTYTDIKERWSFEHNYTIPDFKSTGENGVIKMGVSSSMGFPSIGVVDGNIVGTVVELGYRFAAMYGYDLEIVDMGFNALIPAIQSSKVDFSINDMAKTEERAKQVDFALSYDVTPVSAMVLAERIK